MYGVLISAIATGIMFFALHITGSTAFLKPLSPKEEEEYLSKAATGDQSAKEKVIEHNLRLVAHVIKKYYTKSDEDEDLISIGTIGLINAVNSYNYKKGVRFATFASRCIENEILMYFRAKKKQHNEVFFDEPIDTDCEGNTLTLIDIIPDENEVCDNIEKKLVYQRLHEAVGSIPSSRERIIIKLRYGLCGGTPMPQREVAKIMGISRSYVSRIEKKALAYLNDCLQDLK